MKKKQLLALITVSVIGATATASIVPAVRPLTAPAAAGLVALGHAVWGGVSYVTLQICDLINRVNNSNTRDHYMFWPEAELGPVSTNASPPIPTPSLKLRPPPLVASGETNPQPHRAVWVVEWTDDLSKEWITGSYAWGEEEDMQRLIRGMRDWQVEEDRQFWAARGGKRKSAPPRTTPNGFWRYRLIAD